MLESWNLVCSSKSACCARHIGYGNYWMYSSTLSFYVVDNTPPATPQGLSISQNPGNDAVNLTWNANTESDIDSYEISRMIVSGSWVVLGTTSSTSYIDNSWKLMWPSESTIHIFYKVRAKDINGNYSSYSSTADCWPFPMNKANPDNTNVPSNYDLANYPNPFNPTTKIKFSLPEVSHVTLKVYDVLGKEVASLLNETKNAGKYEIDFNASDLPSGTYIYCLSSGNQQIVRKMLLVK